MQHALFGGSETSKYCFPNSNVTTVIKVQCPQISLGVSLINADMKENYVVRAKCDVVFCLIFAFPFETAHISFALAAFTNLF
jgi:hypothetical protein